MAGRVVCVCWGHDSYLDGGVQLVYTGKAGGSANKGEDGNQYPQY